MLQWCDKGFYEGVSRVSQGCYKGEHTNLSPSPGAPSPGCAYVIGGSESRDVSRGGSRGESRESRGERERAEVHLSCLSKICGLGGPSLACSPFKRCYESRGEGAERCGREQR